MSMDARGQLGKTLVFLGWKGIKSARSYVVPANPRSTGQVAQRGLLSAAVALYHSVAKVAADIAALNLAASLQSMPMSGFNWFCKQYIALIATADAVTVVYGQSVIENESGGFKMHVHVPIATNCLMRHGQNPRVLGAWELMQRTPDTQDFSGTVIDAVIGDYTYCEVSIQDPAGTVAISGIYKVLSLE